MVAVPLNQQTHAVQKQDSARRPVAVAAAVLSGGVLVGVAARVKQGSTPATKRARQQLVLELQQDSLDSARVDSTLETLVASAAKEMKWDEGLIAGEAWQVVYSRGPLLWYNWAAADGWVFGVSSNKATLEFSPADRRLVSKGQLFGLGDKLCLTTEGTYEFVDEEQVLPKPIKTNVTSGALHVWGHQISFPVRSSGLLHLAYADNSLRVLQFESGASAIQVRQDCINSLLSK